ncbi:MULTISPECIES: (Fe-S)-binding protein [Sporosarcina]|uniref:(Fe-S)-binding protein n=1 Tax=Sporosarcina TaxID=1569 RepID=UPI00129A3E1A|nr:MULTISPECIES: (Fe-S)-binding protein [Sporosarcina]GKV65347.1 lactate utilization protein A [Sporosarcina sp. NCCP-2331]GLB55471.1 lactate utilization protein A [Sporosarcina sp. NCCP-2378]
MKVSLFITCLVDMFYAEAGKDMTEVLERQGCELSFPKGQICCGQPAYNSGYVENSKSAMKNMIKTFESAEYVVTPSGSCATMFKMYPEIFADEPKWKDKAQELADKTYEFTEFLVDVLKVENVGAKLTGKGTYHPSCHMTRLLGVKEPPKKLLAQVEGLEMIPLPNAHNCCGFGGTFSVKMGDISEQMVDEKVDSAMVTEADYLIGADCGCLMNIGGRAERTGKKIRVMHIAEVLNSRE